MKRDKGSRVSRRDLLKSATVAAGSLGLVGLGFDNGFKAAPADAQDHDGHEKGQGSVIGMKFPPREIVRLAFIGVGGRGSNLLENVLAIENVQVTGICDVAKDKVLKAQSMAEKA